MSYRHLVGNKTKLVVLSLFAGLFLSVGLANAQTTLTNHQETEVIDGYTYYYLKNQSADSSGETFELWCPTDCRELIAKYIYPLENISVINPSDLTFYYREGVGAQDMFGAYFNVDIIIRESDGTIRETIDTEVAQTPEANPNYPYDYYPPTWATLEGEYFFEEYEVIDQTDYLEIDYYLVAHNVDRGMVAWLRVDDNLLDNSLATRIENWDFTVIPPIPPCLCGDYCIEELPYNLVEDNSTYCVDENLLSSTDGIIYGTENTVLDCQGYVLNGTGSGQYRGIRVTGFNNTIKNCVVINFEQAMFLNNSINGTVINNTFLDNWGTWSGAFDIYNSVNNTIENNTIQNSASYGIYIHDSSLSQVNTFNRTDNYIRNNILINNSYGGIRIDKSDVNFIINNTIEDSEYVGIYLVYHAENNTIVNNTIANSGNVGIYLYTPTTDNIIYNNLLNNTNNVGFFGTVYSNYWNTTKQNGTRIYSNGTQIGGNYYTNSTGNDYSDTCTDTNRDGFCDSSYELETNNIDYLPYSNKYGLPLPPEPVCEITFEDCLITSLEKKQFCKNIEKCAELFTRYDCLTLENCLTVFNRNFCYKLFYVEHNQNFCQDNVTLGRNITYIIGGNTTNFVYTEYCHYGCSNESLQCNPEPFQVNLMIIGGIIGFIIVLLILLKLLRLI